MAINNPDRISITDVEITTQVSPGGRIALSWAINYEEGGIQPPTFGSIYQNPDYCTAPNLGGGVRMDVRVAMDGTEQHSREVCWPMHDTGRVDRTDFLAPTNPGEYGITIELYGRTEGEFVDTHTETVEVVGSDNGDGPVVGDCPTGFERDENGQCVPTGGGNGSVIPGDGDGILGNLEGVGTLVVLSIGGLVAIKALDTLDQPESAEDAEPQADRVEGVPLPLDQREPDTDDPADDEGD